jgi:hypothetical protein
MIEGEKQKKSTITTEKGEREKEKKCAKCIINKNQNIKSENLVL